jgi:hypothetical protein
MSMRVALRKTYIARLQLPTLYYSQWYSRFLSCQWDCFTFANHQHAGGIQYFAKDHVLIIQPLGRSCCDEKLASIGIWTAIGHGQHARLCVLVKKIFVPEGPTAINRILPSSITIDKVATLGIYI